MTKDDLARLRHEASEHRATARRLDDLARAMRSRDLLAALHYRSAARERRLLAKRCDCERQEWWDQQHIARIVARRQAPIEDR